MIVIATGEPKPQGSKEYKGRTKTGRGIIAEANPDVRTWRGDVMLAAHKAMDADPDGFERYDCPLMARMVFSFDRPRSVSRARRPFPSVKPDLGKLARAVEDALKAAGVIRDDALIVEYTRLAKVYCKEDEDALEIPPPGRRRTP